MFSDNFFKYQRIVIGIIILGLITFNFIDKKFSTNKVIATTLNVRECPNTDCLIIDKLHKNDKVDILDESIENGWVKIKANSIEGFVSIKYISETSIFSSIGNIERISFIIIGLVIILFVSFGIPFMFIKEVLDSMGFENNHAIMFLIGIGILGAINFMTNPIFLTILAIIGLIYFLAVALIDGYFLNEMINMKVEMLLLKTRDYDRYMTILKIFGYLGIAFGGYQLVVGLINTE